MSVWILPVSAALAVLVVVGLLVVRHRRSERRRRRERRVCDELAELDIETVQVFLHPVDPKAPHDLGQARAARRRGALARRGTGFLLAAERPKSWPPRTGFHVVVRFESRRVRHELRCRVAGRVRLTPLGRRRFGVQSRILHRLVPAGVIVKRERRDMMRFYVGEASPKLGGRTDARRFLDMQARLRSTDLDATGQKRLPVRLRADALRVFKSESPAQDAGVADGVVAEVLDFSGSGLLVEADGVDARSLLAGAGAEESPDLELLADRALLVEVSVNLTFPPKVEDLEPGLPSPIWFLAEVARLFLLDGDDGEPERVRLGLDLLYQTLEMDEATRRPRRWALIKGHHEADDLVAIHNALNQAAAQIEADDLVGRDRER